MMFRKVEITLPMKITEVAWHPGWPNSFHNLRRNRMRRSFETKRPHWATAGEAAGAGDGTGTEATASNVGELRRLQTDPIAPTELPAAKRAG